MPRLDAAIRVPSDRRHKPSGQAVVTLNGRDSYLGKCNTQASRIESDRLIGEWLANGQRILRPYLLRPADAFCFSPQESNVLVTGPAERSAVAESVPWLVLAEVVRTSRCPWSPYASLLMMFVNLLPLTGRSAISFPS